MTVTVVIPCYNEQDYVGYLLDNLTNQTVQADAVFVVDCHSEDKTVLVAKEFVKKLPLTILQAPYRSAASARNTGAEAAKTDYLLFLDADERIKPNFISRLKDKVTTKQVDFVTPRLAINGYHPFDHLLVWILNIWVYFYRMLIRRQASAPAGASMMIRKATHEAMGGFNPILREFDDIDYIHRAWKQNISFAFAWRAKAITSNRRLVKQGRLATFVQGIPSHYFFVSHFIRPLMRKIGINPKWHDVE